MRWVDAARHLPIDDPIFDVLVAVPDNIECSYEAPNSLAKARWLCLRGFDLLDLLSLGIRGLGLSILGLGLMREQRYRNSHSNYTEFHPCPHGRLDPNKIRRDPLKNQEIDHLQVNCGE
jgi:hypothetical protein